MDEFSCSLSSKIKPVQLSLSLKENRFPIWRPLIPFRLFFKGQRGKLGPELLVDSPLEEVLALRRRQPVYSFHRRGASIQRAEFERALAEEPGSGDRCQTGRGPLSPC